MRKLIGHGGTGHVGLGIAGAILGIAADTVGQLAAQTVSLRLPEMTSFT